ncbi:MAG TPA: hypothetical protein VJB02_02060 [Coxiellaceae bacterium]|nr:hypothetical protein [Coxiellaceae bacterium]
MRKLGEYLLSTNSRASAIALGCALLPLLSIPGDFLAGIIVGLVTLRKGMRAGLIVLAWVALPAVSMLYLRQWGVFEALWLRCALVWIFAGVLRRYSWRRVFEGITLLGIVAVAVVHGIMPDVKQLWIKAMHTYYQSLSADLWGVNAEQINTLITRVAPYATGAAASGVAFSTVIQLMLARVWEGVLTLPGLFKAEFIRTRMPWGACVVLMGIAVAISLKWPVALDMALMALFPFWFCGLALLHYLANYKPRLWMPLLGALYVVMIFLPLIGMSMVALSGFVDGFINIRHRFVLKMNT